jgi:hypothetical protein
MISILVGKFLKAKHFEMWLVDMKKGDKRVKRRDEKHVAHPLIISASDSPPYSFCSLMMVGSPSQ